jgi:hypothetical protein
MEVIQDDNVIRTTNTTIDNKWTKQNNEDALEKEGQKAAEKLISYKKTRDHIVEFRI